MSCDSSEKDLSESSSKGEKTKMYAVGVADSGPGLSESALTSAETAIITKNSKSSVHGAQNTGFGLYHAHLQAKALNTKLHLTTPDKCRHFLNEDICNAIACYKKNSTGDKESLDMSMRDEPGPGRGTVIYLTIPVCDDESLSTAQELEKKVETTALNAAIATHQFKYSFYPLPSVKSPNECFRILAADDVLMLRKGMVHAISTIWRTQFPSCPVSVCTACTAEDVIRAARSEPFDLIFCDHIFDHDQSKLLSLSSEEIATKGRPCAIFNGKGSSQEISRNVISEFFKGERFTLLEGDGSLKGLDALQQLAETKNPPFPIPILVLISGHEVQISPDYGIICVQKPLKTQGELIPLLQFHVEHMLKTGRLVLDNGIVRNGNGSQMFVSNGNSSSSSGELKEKT